MRRAIIVTLMFIAFALVFSGLSYYSSTAHAMGFIPGHHHRNPPPPPPPQDGGGPVQGVPEPITLAMLGVGIAGIGVYSIIKKRIDK